MEAVRYVWNVQICRSKLYQLSSHHWYAVAPQEICNQAVVCAVIPYGMFKIRCEPELTRCSRLLWHQGGTLLPLESHIRGSAIQLVADWILAVQGRSIAFLCRMQWTVTESCLCDPSLWFQLYLKTSATPAFICNTFSTSCNKYHFSIKMMLQ